MISGLIIVTSGTIGAALALNMNYAYPFLFSGLGVCLIGAACAVSGECCETQAKALVGYERPGHRVQPPLLSSPATGGYRVTPGPVPVYQPVTPLFHPPAYGPVPRYPVAYPRT